MSAGNPTIDELMIPVSKAIARHVKYPSDAFTDIYNRAYEAIQNSMDATREAQMDASRLQEFGMFGKSKAKSTKIGYPI